MPGTPLYERIPALVNGISKQSPTVRYPGQVADAENVNFSVVDGVSKRKGTSSFLHFPNVNPTVQYRLHKIERDEDEEYCVIIGSGLISGGPLCVFNVNTGEVASMTYEAGTTSYLSAGEPVPADFRLATIADTTFITNRNVLVQSQEAGGAVSGKLDASTMPVIMQRTNATLGSLTFVVSQPDWKERTYYQQILSTTTTDADSGEFKLEYLGDSTCQKAEASDDPDDDDYAEPFVHKLTYKATALEVEEYLAGNAYWPPQEGTTEDVPAISGLETIEYGKIQVVGGPLPKKEIVINFSTDLNVDSMITLVGNGVSNLTCKRGSNDNNPAPKFSQGDGKAIQDIAFHKNRLVLAADEFINFSRVDDLYNFYIEIADNITDSDTIEVQLASTEVTVVDTVLPFRRSVLIFTKTGKQFELDQSGDVLSPSTTNITPSTAYETQPVEPITMGDRIFLCGRHSKYGIIYEYYYDDSIVSNKAVDVTKHVFDLIPPTIIGITASPTMDMLLVMPEDKQQEIAGLSFSSRNLGATYAWETPAHWGDGSGSYCPQPWDDVTIRGSDVMVFTSSFGPATPVVSKGPLKATSVYTYRQYIEGNEKKQSAWSRWTFGRGGDADFILDCKAFDNELFLLRRDDQQGNNPGAGLGSSALFIEKVSLSDERDILDDDYPYDPCMDHMIDAEATHLGSHIYQWKFEVNKWDGGSSSLAKDDVKDRSIDTGKLRIVLSNSFGNDVGKIINPWEERYGAAVDGWYLQKDGSRTKASNNDGTQEYATFQWNTSTATSTDLATWKVRMGRKVDMKVELSQLFFRTDKKTPTTLGRTMMQRILVDHLYSGPYKVRVDTVRGGETQSRTVEWTPDGWNPLFDNVGQNVFTENFGTSEHWVHGNTYNTSIFLESDSAIPVTISSLEYHGVHASIRGVES
jgi:hypothetical protein